MLQARASSIKTFETFSKDYREKLALGGREFREGPRKSRKNAKITVVVRKRPLTSQEASRNEFDIVQTRGKKVMNVAEQRKNVCGNLYTENHTFEFDRAYSARNSNDQVYNSCIKGLVDAVFTENGKCSCFTYGQTGSGKTFTMAGERSAKGVLEYAAHDCFKWLQTPELDFNYGLFLSFFEIYCNKVYDLLGERRLVRALETRTADGVVVKDLTTVRVETPEQLLQLVRVGIELRVVGSNSKNADSSRGHAVLSIELRNEASQTVTGKLAFIDLAGSERGADAMYSGKQTQTDGAGINRSLLALKECIRALDQENSHVPFRDSELTKVLRDMFIGSNARTVMIACVSPSSACCEQTLNTLRYAERVKAIRRNCEPDIRTSSSSSEEESADAEKAAPAAAASESSRFATPMAAPLDNGTTVTNGGSKRANAAATAALKKKGFHVRRESKQEGVGSCFKSSVNSSSVNPLSQTTVGVIGSHAKRDCSLGRNSEISSVEPGGANGVASDSLSLGTSHDDDSNDCHPKPKHRPRRNNAFSRNAAVSTATGAPFGGAREVSSSRVVSNQQLVQQQQQPHRRSICKDSPIVRPHTQQSVLHRPTTLYDSDILSNRGAFSSRVMTTKEQASITPAPESPPPHAATAMRGTDSSTVGEYFGSGGTAFLLSALGGGGTPADAISPRSTNLAISCVDFPGGGHHSSRPLVPRMESSDVTAAANYLRRRGPIDGFPQQILAMHCENGIVTRDLDAAVAERCIRDLYDCPAEDLEQFDSRLEKLVKGKYDELVETHKATLKGTTCGAITQQALLRSASSRSLTEYTSSLRQCIESQMALQSRLARGLRDVERVAALQRVVEEALRRRHHQKEPSFKLRR